MLMSMIRDRRRCCRRLFLRARRSDALEELTEADQLAVQAAMVEMDQKQTMKLFSTISNVAFNECVNSFRGRSERHTDPRCPSGSSAAGACAAFRSVFSSESDDRASCSGGDTQLQHCESYPSLATAPRAAGLTLARLLHVPLLSFSSSCRALEKSESKCIENIVGKYMQHFQRTNVRFGESERALADRDCTDAHRRCRLLAELRAGLVHGVRLASASLRSSLNYRAVQRALAFLACDSVGGCFAHPLRCFLVVCFARSQARSSWPATRPPLPPPRSSKASKRAAALSCVCTHPSYSLFCPSRPRTSHETPPLLQLLCSASRPPLRR